MSWPDFSGALQTVVSDRTTFVAAFSGAAAAFVLDAWFRHRKELSQQQASINMAILLMAQMYSVLKNYYDQVFVDERKKLREKLGDDPLPVQYKPASGTAEQRLTINVSELSPLIKSYDRDILNRVLWAERIYLSNRATMTDYLTAHRAFQRKTAESKLPVVTTVRDIKNAVGEDLYGQVNDLAESLRNNLEEDAKNILKVCGELRVVARYHYLTRLFIEIGVKGDPNFSAGNPRPPRWRRAVRAVVDRLRERVLGIPRGWLLITAALLAAVLW